MSFKPTKTVHLSLLPRARMRSRGKVIVLGVHMCTKKNLNERLNGYLHYEALTQGSLANVDTNTPVLDAKDGFCTPQFAVSLDNSACSFYAV